MSAADLGPLDWRMAITDASGRPTPEFQRRWATQRTNNGLIVSKFIELEDAPTSYTGAHGELVRVNSGETGLEFATPSTVLDSFGLAQGDILFRGPTGWTVLAPGTATQLLQTGGPSGNPSWVNAPVTLPSIANNTLLANTSGSAAVPVATTLTTLIDSALGNVRGDILFRNVTGWVVLAPGVVGQFLQTGGSGADPSWAIPSSSFIPLSLGSEPGQTVTDGAGDFITIPYAG